MKRKIILYAAIALFGLLPLCAQTAATAPEKLSTDEIALRRKSFEMVWNTVNEQHFDPTFGGVDWRKAREIYEPKAMAAQSRGDFHNVLRQMLGELKLSHFGILPRAAVPTANQVGDGTTGIEAKIVDGQVVVYRVVKDSPAEKAGVKTGFVVEKIDGKAVSDVFAPLEKMMAARSLNERVRNIYRERTAQSLIDGKAESIAKIEMTDDKNQPRAFEFARLADKSEMSEAFGNFPAQKVLFEARRLDGNVGYIRFNMWTIPQMAKIRQAIRDFADARGIIFDLRGNPGGVGGMASGVAGLLTAEKISLGTMTSRSSEQKFSVYPQENPFRGKVVILSDYGTGSTSEVFAAGMQDNGRAQVFGTRSAGAVLPSIFVVLPTDAIFQYAISDYKSPKNVLIEGRGVAPDTEIKLTRQSLLDGRDAPLDAAVKAVLN